MGGGSGGSGSPKGYSPDDWAKDRKRAGKYGFPMGLLIKWGLSFMALMVVLGVIFGVGIFALDWFRAGRDVFGPENVREQFRLAYDRYEGLEALAEQVCNFDTNLAAAESPSARQQIADQRLAVANNYSRVRAQYEAAYDDAFRAGLVGPRDLPEKAPALDEMQALVC